MSFRTTTQSDGLYEALLTGVQHVLEAGTEGSRVHRGSTL